MIWLVVLAALLVVFLLLELKTSRFEGDLVRVHPYRRLMPIIMPSRNESLVYFDESIDAENLVSYLEAARERFPADMTPAVVAAANIALHGTPSMNGFCVGRRLYQRRGRHITFSMKRKRMDKKAKLSVVKMAMGDGDSFADLCERVETRVNVERSGVRTSADLEYAILERLPRLVLQAVRRLAQLLDYFNLLPAWFIRADGMYTSIFVANLGSLEMGAGYHHLYEWGTCPLFIMVGMIEERAVVRDGEIVARPILPIRFTFDERIDDGLTAGLGIALFKRVLEDPVHYLGCLEEGDQHPLVPMRKPAEE